MPEPPGQLLDDAVEQLRAVCERSRADALAHRMACLKVHLETQALVRELGRMLQIAPQRPDEPGPQGEQCALDFGPTVLRRRVTDIAASDELFGLPPPTVLQAQAVAAEAGSAPSVQVYLLSPFRVFANDRAIDDWPNCKGRSIFKYLVMHRAQPVAKEVLMDTFWPGADPDAARNNLNVAVYGLRKALARADPQFAFVLFRQGSYALNPALRLWVDAEDFHERLALARAAEQRGDLPAALAEYHAALATYQSALLLEDRYDDWLVPHRQSLQESFVQVLQRLRAHHLERGDLEACIGVATRLLEVDRCDEDAHRVLMRCYSRLGQVNLALRQYHFCVDTLARELNLIPSPQTVALFQQIRRREPV